MNLWSRRKSTPLLGISQLSSLSPTRNEAASLPASPYFKDIATSYELLESIGSGSVAVVRRARHLSDGCSVAVKCIATTDPEMRQFTRTEFELAKNLCHMGILRMESLHEAESCVYICMELCSDGSVGGYLEKHGCFQEDRARDLFGQLVPAVNYLHRKRIVHRDLKPDNLLLHDSAKVIKIADFNSAKQIGDSFNSCMLTDRGTRSYSAPELRFGLLWNERVDVWALGLCFYVMLKGVLPFDIQCRKVSECLLSGKLPPVQWGGVSQLQQNLILQCLAINMRDRPPAFELMRHRALCFPDQFHRLPPRRPSQDLYRSGLMERAGTSTILSQSCGLLCIQPLQTGLARGKKIDDWMESRDGSLQLARLADTKFEKVEVAKEAEHRQGPDYVADEEQPMIGRDLARKHCFTRSSLVDVESADSSGTGTSQPPLGRDNRLRLLRQSFGFFR